jgi:hypothetical protein
MKKLIISLLFVAISFAGFAQGPWSGFILNVKDNPGIKDPNFASRNLTITGDSTYNLRLMRFNMDVGGIQVLYNKVTREIKPEAFLKLGIGLSLSFYKVTNGVPNHYLSVNGFVFLPITETNQSFSIAATVAAFKLFGTNLSPEIGFNFEPGNIKSDYFPVGPLVGLKYRFE